MLGRHAQEVGCQLIAAGCASDHVHVIARLSSSVALGELVRRMKGASAHELNHPWRFTEHFACQLGYWAESLSPADLNPTIDYVTSQRQHHDAAHPAERWASAPSFSSASKGVRLSSSEKPSACMS